MIRIALKERGSLGFSKKLKMSFTVSFLQGYRAHPCGEPRMVNSWGRWRRERPAGRRAERAESQLSSSAPHLVGDLARERGKAGRDAGRLLRGAPGHRRVLDQLDVQAQRL